MGNAEQQRDMVKRRDPLRRQRLLILIVRLANVEKQRFREACADARTKAGWDLSRIAAADSELSDGGGRPVGEAFDELRRRPHTSGG